MVRGKDLLKSEVDMCNCNEQLLSSEVQCTTQCMFCYYDVNNILTGNEIISVCVVFCFYFFVANLQADQMEHADLKKI